jgi:adenylate cyclase class 2
MAIEYEVRFLEIDKSSLITRLHELGARDTKEFLLNETIYYDSEGKWQNEGKLVRVRSKDGGEAIVTYKHHRSQSIGGAYEIEFRTHDVNEIDKFIQQVGLVFARKQQKLRHTFQLNGATVDLDTWPNVPTYVEIEGLSEDSVRGTVAQLGLKWEDAVFEDARSILENRYSIPIRSLTHYTFDIMK